MGVKAMTIPRSYPFTKIPLSFILIFMQQIKPQDGYFLI